MAKLHGKSILSQFELLIIQAQAEGAEIIELPLRSGAEYAKYVDGYIGINANLSDTIKYELIAEEVGHHRKTYGNITDKSDIRNLKLENIARREGFKILLDPHDFLEPLKSGARNLYEFSEHLDISEKTLRNILDDWKKIYGMGITIGDYYLNLSQI